MAWGTNARFPVEIGPHVACNWTLGRVCAFDPFWLVYFESPVCKLFLYPSGKVGRSGNNVPEGWPQTGSTCCQHPQQILSSCCWRRSITSPEQRSQTKPEPILGPVALDIMVGGEAGSRELRGRWARGEVREKERWGERPNWWLFASLSRHSFQGWDCVPLDDERSLVLSFPEPPLCRTLPVPLPPLPLPSSAARSFSACSDPLSERREFWREGVLGWRDSWPFFSSGERTNRQVECEKRTQLVSECARCLGGRGSLTSQCLHGGLIVSTEELRLNGFHHSLEPAAGTCEKEMIRNLHFVGLFFFFFIFEG